MYYWDARNPWQGCADSRAWTRKKDANSLTWDCHLFVVYYCCLLMDASFALYFRRKGGKKWFNFFLLSLLAPLAS